MSFGTGDIGIGSLDYSIGVDVSEPHAALDNLESRTMEILDRTVNSVRQGWDTLIQFAALTGQAIEQSYQLMAQGIFVAAETLLAIAHAEAATGLLALKAGFSFGLAVALVGKGLEIQQKGETARLEADNIIGLASLWRLY